MNKDLAHLINESMTGYNSWKSLLPEGNHFEWILLIDSTQYKLNRFVPRITKFKPEWTLFEMLDDTTTFRVRGGDEKDILEFFKSIIRDKKLKELGI